MKSGNWLGRLGSLETVGDMHNQLGSKVWGIQGPPKLRHFLWRACKGSLPVNVTRFRRHMHDSDVCT